MEAMKGCVRLAEVKSSAGKERKGNITIGKGLVRWKEEWQVYEDNNEAKEEEAAQ